MDREEAFEFLDRTARGIAEMFGSTCETLVHDMGDPSHPILSIYNGHVSGRTVGSTLDILGTAKELDEDALVTDFVNLYATTPSGQQIKSSTFHLIGEEIREEIQNIELDLETGRLSSEEMVELECFKERAKALEAEIEVLTEQQGSSMGADVAPGISAEEINAEIVKKNELLTALSSYIAERVRQRFDHLDLNRVSISLYEVSKTTGEVRDVFKFNYEDRPYVILSLSEKIKAGLEVSELLKKIAGINYPVFIDNGESVPVIDNVRPSGQTFISQVVKNEQLRVEILGAAPAGRSEQAA